VRGLLQGSDIAEMRWEVGLRAWMSKYLFRLSDDELPKIRNGRVEEHGASGRDNGAGMLADADDDADRDADRPDIPEAGMPSTGSPSTSSGNIGETPGRLPRLDHFWNHLAAAGRAKLTIQEYHYDLRFWEKRAEALGKTIYTLQARDMEAALTGYHPATVRRKIAFLRTLGRWYLREGFPRLNGETTKVRAPRIPERLPRDRGAKQFVELRELAKKWCGEGKREGVWVGLMLMSGLRISEIATATADEQGRAKVIGKGSKERLIPAAGWALEAMAKIQKEGVGGWGQGRKTIWKILNRHRIRRPHSLRHTYASELMRRGKKIEEIRVLLGHKRIDTTSIYAQADIPQDVVELLDKD